MTNLKSLLVGFGLSIGLATVASAQSMRPDINDGTARVAPRNGSVGYLAGYAGNASATTGHRLLMKQATRLKAGMTRYRPAINLDAMQNRVGGETAEQPWQGWRRNF